MADGGGSFQIKRRLQLVMQGESTECGHACLVMIARYHGHLTTLAALRRQHGPSLRGSTLAGLMRIAAALGLEARALRAEPEYLETIDGPCILHWDMNHFVVLNRCARGKADIFDPAVGRYTIPYCELLKHFTGVLLELSPAVSFKRIAETGKISLRDLTGPLSGLKRSLLQLLIMAAAIEALGLAMPFQVQWVLDQAVAVDDERIAVPIAVGFCALTVLQLGLSLARGWLLSWLGSTINAQWTRNLFGHLVDLPSSFFERRHLGDIVSRFTSLQSIQTTLTGAFMEAILDGVMSFLTLAILLCYSPLITLVVLASVAIYAALRWVLYGYALRISGERLHAVAKQQSELMESVRGVQAVKLANKQVERKNRLGNLVTRTVAYDMRTQRVDLSMGAASRAVFSFQRVATVTICAALALKGAFSAGMMVAFIAFADQFNGKVGNLIDKFAEFRSLSLHKERLFDIAGADVESNVEGSYAGPDPSPSISVRGLSFRYSSDEPWIFRDLSFDIEAGESVAIVGPSGCGKTTLAKILNGLIQPESGTVLIGGVDMRHLGIRRCREMASSVMQDDHLFAGSIGDNVTFFDEGPSATLENVVAACVMAGVHDDIVRMPMGYETLVGDMGSSLSGGQKQRIILARALYRKPSILILDEATSHLDTTTESYINRIIGGMSMTRITIAHRPETIASAERVIDLQSTQ